MGQIIKFINSRNEEIEFSIIEPYLLSYIDGFSEIKSINVTTKGYRQDGERYKDSFLDIRQLVIGFTLKANSKEDLMILRDKVIRCFNPKLGEGYLYYKYCGIERRIKCKADSSPIIPLVGNQRDVKGEVILIAYNPYFEDIHETGESIVTLTGGLKFPLKSPFKLRQKGETKKNIYNNGHEVTPINISFKGPAVNPKVTNHTTGEYIKINRELASGDTLLISTEYGNKSVEIHKSDGSIDDAFNYIRDLNSTFFSLAIGDNIIEYSTDNFEPQGVEIRYRNRYIGV